MIEAHIDPRDLRELDADLKALMPKHLLKRYMDPLGRSIVDEASRYPPPSGYPRTGHLGRSWYNRVYGLDLKVGNLAHYAGYVVGDEQTNAAANVGWKKVRDVMTKKIDEFVQKLEREIDRLWR